MFQINLFLIEAHTETVAYRTGQSKEIKSSHF